MTTENPSILEAERQVLQESVRQVLMAVLSPTCPYCERDDQDFSERMDVAAKALLPLLESQRRMGQIEVCGPSGEIKVFIRSHDPQLYRVYGARFYTVGIDAREWDAMFPGVVSPGLSFASYGEVKP